MGSVTFQVLQFIIAAWLVFVSHPWLFQTGYRPLQNFDFDFF